jgi:hypothetical protein
MVPARYRAAGSLVSNPIYPQYRRTLAGALARLMQVDTVAYRVVVGNGQRVAPEKRLRFSGRAFAVGFEPRPMASPLFVFQLVANWSERLGHRGTFGLRGPP